MKSFVQSCVVVAILLGVETASAATIGYWRFENSPGFLVDSSPDGRTLTAVSAPTQYPLPGTGVGSTFPTTIPQTGASNANAAQFNGNNRFTAPDAAAFNSPTLTLEAFINGNDFGTSTANKSIVGHWNGTTGIDQRSWLLAAGNSISSPLSFLFSTDGINTTTISSGISLLPNIDYYVAASVNIADTSTSGITFYVKDLTNNTALQTVGVAHSGTSFFDSTAPLTIGATNTPTSPFTGVIDEVRVSNTKLPVGQLLISQAVAVPEPSTCICAGLGLVGLIAVRRRRIARHVAQ